MSKKVGRPAGSRSVKTYPRVKELLDKKIKKQKELAEYLSMDSTILSNVLHARKGLTDDNAEKMAEFFDYEVSAAYIQGKTDDPNPGIANREYAYDALLKNINSVIGASMDLFEAYGITFEYYCLSNEIDTIPDKYVLKYPMLSTSEPSIKSLEHMYHALTNPIQESVIYSVKRKGTIIAFITYADLRHLQYMVDDFMNIQFVNALQHMSLVYNRIPRSRTSNDIQDKFLKTFKEERPDQKEKSEILLDIAADAYENIHMN